MEAWTNAKSTQSRKYNFEYAFRPIYYFSRLTGRIQKARIGFFDFLWSILVISLNLLFAFLAYGRMKVRREKNTIRIRSIVFNMFQIGSLLFGAIDIILDVINRQKLVDILRKFNEFDNEVRFPFTELPMAI